jgi:hypothetical protein
VPFEVYGRICVGAVLAPEPAIALHAEFLESLGLAPDAPAEEVFAALRAETKKHKLHEPDRVRYELALEAFIDAKWDVDFALGGLSRDGLFDPRRGYLFVGVRVEQFETVIPELPRGAADPSRPQWLRKGDLTPGSDFSKSLGPDARKQVEHAARAYQRASREIHKDALARVKPLPISKQHEPDWALCRWLVDVEHASVLPRHGRARE